MRKILKQKTGVLLVNLGTPKAADKTSIRAFLGEFLADHRVVEIPRFIWLGILYCFILPFRPKHLVKSYQKIWTDEGSPLLKIAYQQEKKLHKKFNDLGFDTQQLIFATAMRYGQPSIQDALAQFAQQKVEHLIILPLYPQYSGSTTAAIFDAVTKELQQWRNIPALSFIKHYHDHPLYIQALANSVKQKVSMNALLLMSFHGIPIAYCEKGDPYAKECEQTAQLLANELGLNGQQWQLSYQSLFGKAEWLKPYTSQQLKLLVAQGVDKVDIICPGFSNDCLETLEEIAIENKAVFKQAGGKQYQYIPALNAGPLHIEMMASLIQEKMVYTGNL